MSSTTGIQADIVALAELAVGFGANVQPGQIVAVSSEPGKEHLARAVAEAAYARGALFVDVSVFDVHVKRARLRHADPATLEFVPSWIGDRVTRLGEEKAALVSLNGPVAPHVMDDVDPALLGRDMLPRVRESNALVDHRLINWTAVPCPNADWAALVYPDLPAEDALARLWEDVAHICRLRDDDPVAAWNDRLSRLIDVASRLSSLQLGALQFEGPGTDLTIGLFPSSTWMGARFTTADGLVHAPNLPTEEVFTTPDPARAEGTVTSTKPLFISGGLVTGLRIRFESGRAVQIDADTGADTVRALAARDENACRLGEVALVDRDSRIGSLDTVFYDTLLDENAASHIALGQGFGFAIEDDTDRKRVNRSEIHVDFMIGSDAVAVTGLTAAGERLPLLRDGEWQV
jgi:aminopeptidase